MTIWISLYLSRFLFQVWLKGSILADGYFVSSSRQNVDPGDSLNHKHLITNTTISFQQSSLLSVLLVVQFYLFI